MLATISYFIHVFLGQLLDSNYNPITMDISSLTAVGAPNRTILLFFTTIYGLLSIVFIVSMIFKSSKEYHGLTKLGYFILLIMQITSLFGYGLFPLKGDKNDMNFQNLMHIIVTIVVVFTTVASILVIAIGYIKKDGLKLLGKICLTVSILIILFGALNPISIAMDIDILGLTERLVIFTLQIFIFFLSFVYTFNVKMFLKNSI